MKLDARKDRGGVKPLWCMLMLILVGCGRTSNPSAPANRLVSSDADSLDSQDPFHEARIALAKGDFVLAKRYAQEGMILFPNSVSGAELLGDIHSASGDIDSAVDYYQLAKDTSLGKDPSGDLSAALLDKLGRALMSQSRPFEALSILKLNAQQNPNTKSIRIDLAGLLLALGREREAMPHLQWLVQRGYGHPGLLVALTDLSRPQTNEQMCQASLKRNPEDLRPQYSLARLDIHFGRWREAALKLKPLISEYPQDSMTLALYGRAIVELGDPQAIDDWLERLSKEIEQEPDYWMAAGVSAEKGGNIQAAARCFWQAVLLDDFNAEALHRLAACLTELNEDTEIRKRLATRVDAINNMRRQVDQFSASQYNSQATAVRIAKALNSMGRSWEAAAWLRVGATLNADRDNTLVGVYQGIREQLTGSTPWQRPEFLLAKQFDLSHLPSIDWKLRSNSSIVKDKPRRATLIHFEDEARQRGLQHVCSIKKPSGDEAGLWIYQSVAGGLGTLDFDLDGWPDLYFTAMDGTPNHIDSSPNRLFRNHQGDFEEVTKEASVGDRGFAMGISIGDYNADGFPDLYVANIGLNRLYRNNGDGTFNDVTNQVGINGNQWTSSVAMLDIDQDGHLDLFDVGYCHGDAPFRNECTRDGFTRSCSPLSFSGQQDRVWQGTAEGSFHNVSEQWFQKHTPSCGLGIMAGRLDEVPGLDIYVANDMAPNHFWSSARQEGNRFSLIDQAAIRGLAVDSRSLAQASMGIAAADPDHDGDYDLFLTNHANEPNVLYEQVSPGIWLDRTERADLVKPSVPMLGFGTVWFDADNNGSLELMVANGHVDDFSHLNEAFRMPMQMFERNQGGKWEAMDVKELGSYFAKEMLSRNLINVDLDRDGRTDAVVTYLFDPVSLLLNRSQTSAHSLNLFLKGTSSHPDAIGAKVTIEVGEERFYSQLFAGDGFQCSSQRCIRFGLGTSSKVDRVIVEWNEKEIESFGSIDANAEYLLIQGEGVPFELAVTNN